MSNKSGSVTRQGQFFRKRLLDLYEAWQRVELHIALQSSVIWYKSDEPLFYNHIKDKYMSNKSGSVTPHGQFYQKRLDGFV